LEESIGGGLPPGRGILKTLHTINERGIIILIMTIEPKSGKTPGADIPIAIKKKPYVTPKIIENPMTRHFMVCAQNRNKCPPGSMVKFTTGKRCF
jgi:hypothetical protein